MKLTREQKVLYEDMIFLKEKYESACEMGIGIEIWKDQYIFAKDRFLRHTGGKLTCRDCSHLVMHIGKQRNWCNVYKERVQKAHPICEFFEK